VSHVEGTRTDVHPDTEAKTVVIEIGDDAAANWVEEVIQYLTTNLPRRTRKRIRDISQATRERGAAIKIFFNFNAIWDAMFELDILDVLGSFFRERGYQCA
jgi:hypothetical protein